MKAEMRQVQIAKEPHPIDAGEDALLCWERPEDVLPRVHELLDHIADGGVNLYGERPFATTFGTVDHDFLRLPVDPAPFNGGIGEAESGVKADVEAAVHPDRLGRGIDRGNLGIFHLGFKSGFLARYAKFARRIVCSESAPDGLVHDQPEQFKLAQGGIERGVTPRFLFGLASAPIDVTKDPCPVELSGAGNLSVNHVAAQPIPVNPVDVRRPFLGRVSLADVISNPIPRCVVVLLSAGQKFRFYAIQRLRDFKRLIRIVLSDRGFAVTLDSARIRELNPDVRTICTGVIGEDHVGTVANRSKRGRIFAGLRAASEGLYSTLSRLPSSLGYRFKSYAVHCIYGAFSGLRRFLGLTVAKERSKTLENRLLQSPIQSPKKEGK